MRRALAMLLIAAASSAGCGGDDKPSTSGGQGRQISRAGDAKGAESTVRGYLRALVDHDGSAACSKLTPEYQRSVVRRNRQFADKAGVSDCSGLFDAVAKQVPRPMFEGQPIDASNVGTIPLRVEVRQNGKEQNATVMGTRGLERYELYTTGGRWAISEVSENG